MVYSTIKLTNLVTGGPIKIIDRKTSGHPNKKLNSHFCKKIFVDGALMNVITPLTIKAVLKDIINAKTFVLYWPGSFFISIFL